MSRIRSTVSAATLLVALILTALAVAPSSAMAGFCIGAGADCQVILPSGEVKHLKKIPL